MNRTMSRLLASVLICSSAFAVTAAETNVTYVLMRDYRNRADVATQYRNALEIEKGDRIGGTLSLTPFYRHNYHKADWGKGLGINHTNAFSSVDDTVAAGSLNPNQITGGNNAYTGDITINPEHQAWGANISYFQCLSELWDGLYFYANTAIADDHRRDNFTCSSSDLKPYLVKTANKKGRYSESSWETKVGVENPELALGYKFFNNDSGNVSLNIGGSFPTGTDPKGELINEPLVGDKHFRLGAGLMACANLWSDESKSLKLFFDINYRYAFEHSIIAVPHLIQTGNVTAAVSNCNWGHLFRDTGTANSVADLYSSNVKVKPGSELDGYAMLAFASGNFDIDFGYQLFFRQSHTPKAGDAFVAMTTGIENATAGAQVALTAANLGWKREQMVLHHFFAGAGAVMKDWEYPCHFGIGGFIDVAHKHQITPEIWGVFGKVGVSF